MVVETANNPFGLTTPIVTIQQLQQYTSARFDRILSHHETCCVRWTCWRRSSFKATIAGLSVLRATSVRRVRTKTTIGGWQVNEVNTKPTGRNSNVVISLELTFNNIRIPDGIGQTGAGQTRASHGCQRASARATSTCMCWAATQLLSMVVGAVITGGAVRGKWAGIRAMCSPGALCSRCWLVCHTGSRVAILAAAMSGVPNAVRVCIGGAAACTRSD